MSAQKTKRVFPTFLLYSLSFLMLWEWLRPVEQLTETGYINAFLGFVFISLFLSFLRLPALITILIKVFYILYTLYFIYFEGSIFSFMWARSFLIDIKMNIGLVWKLQWVELSDSFRTLLFFILLWAITYLIQYWLIIKKRIFVFFFMTLVVITIMDTFTLYEANAAIIRTVMVGFLVMGMLTFYRLVDTESIQTRFVFTRKWMAPLVLMILGSSFIGYAAPKADPIWPDPVPFIQSFNSESGVGVDGGKRAGYGTDDSSLGGSFVGDDRLVFRTEVDDRHYWKVETKDTYTGKGWVSSGDSRQSFDFNAESVPLMSTLGAVPTELMTSTVFNVLQYPHIQYPHGLVKIDAEESYWYRMDLFTEKISSLQGLESKTPESYTVQYEKPSYQVETLQNNSPGEDDFTFESIQNMYTQLPDNLPASVGELASEITEGAEDLLEKVERIERYFRSNGFIYDQVDVAKPEEGEDYVAQFLFETKRGYCDNFSTSMAVMLRTLDIPARWVKGYTEGEFVETLESGRRVYEVTNNNAHSWVEVFFPEVGWVPFEPTQGFSNNIVFQADNSADSAPETAEDQAVTAPTPVTPQLEVDPLEDASSSASSSNVLKQGIQNYIQANWKSIVGTLFLIVCMISVAYLFRAKWLPTCYVLLYRTRKGDEHFPGAYLVLLVQLERYGLQRGTDQTLRDYAEYIDRIFTSKEMSQLTDQYEQFLYRGTLKEGTWSMAREQWETLIKKTVA